MRRTASASAERLPYAIRAVELAYRQLTMGWVLRFLPSSKAFLRIIVALLASLAYLIATVAIRPYRRLEDNALAVASSAVLVILFVGCALIKSHEDVNLATTLLGDSQLASRVLGFSSTSEIVALLLTFMFGMLLLLAASVAWAMRREGRVRTLRLVSGGQPELGLGQNHKWHAFLSHSACDASQTHSIATDHTWTETTRRV